MMSPRSRDDNVASYLSTYLSSWPDLTKLRNSSSNDETARGPTSFNRNGRRLIGIATPSNRQSW